MKQKTLLLLITLLITSMSYGQGKGVISGLVKDEFNTSLPGASLKLNKHNRYTIAKQNGDFEFLSVPEGTYQIEVNYLGFKSVVKQVEVKPGENSVVEITLEETPLMMGQEIIVIGEMLRGQAKALNKQKTNSNISNIVSADQMGRFPDSNIGDALKRLPSVTMQNDQGEARNIIIRGLSPELNSVTLNGNRIPSAEGDNRNVQMDLVPSDMISSVEVSKTLTPDMDGDAIGGSVDLITRAAPNGQRISTTLSGGYNPIRKSPTYSGSFIYGNRLFNDKLGFVTSLSYLNKEYGSDNIEAEWSKGKDDLIYISQFDLRRYDVQRIRRSVSSAIDYKFNENNTVSADLIYNWRDDRENRFRKRFKGIKPLYDSEGELTGYSGDIRRETKGGKDNRRNKSRRLEDQRIQSYALKGEHLLTEKFALTWNLSYSKASEDRPNERYIDFQQKKLPILSDLAIVKRPLITSLEENYDEMKLRKLTESNKHTDEKEYTGQIDARVPLSVIKNQKGRLRFGLKTRIKSKNRNDIHYSYEPIEKTGSLSDLPTSNWDNKSFAPGSQYNLGSFISKNYLGNLDLNNALLFNETVEPLEFLASNYNAKEQIYAGYLRWDQNITNDILVIVGLRAEQTHINYTGNSITDDQTAKKERKTNSYLNLLPSINIKYAVNDKLILRTAFTTALARPNYYHLVPYENIRSDDMNIQIGNPNLKATYSHNFDLMGEYYIQSVGILSAGVFYKNLSNFIYNYKNIEYNSNNFEQDFPHLTNPIPAGDNWNFTQHRNGDDVDVLGFEVALQRKLDFLPTQFLKNFGVYFNYTYSWSKAKGIADSEGNIRKGIKLPGTAPHILNGSLSWDNSKFSARVSLNYTSDYVDKLGADGFSDSFYDKQLFLDANATYKFNSNFRLFAEAKNLTNQALRYYQGEKERTMQLEYYRPTFNMGATFNF